MSDEPIIPAGTERRHFELVTESFDFDVLVIDSPEKWPEAKEFKNTYNMPLPGNTERMSVEVTGISTQDWKKVEDTFKEPEAPDLEDKGQHEVQALKAAFEKRVKENALHKQVTFFQLATGKDIPGNTMEEKAAFLAERDETEINALYTYIMEIASGMVLGDMGHIYEQVSNNKTNQTSVVMNSFGDWKKATDTKAYFRFQRQFEVHLCEIPFKGVSQTDRLKIEMECVDPEPPLMPGINPATGMRSVTHLTPDTNNAMYKRNMEAVNQKRIAMTFDACFPFRIPGNDYAEKWDWISRRMIGDLLNIKKFVDGKLMNHRGRFDFFTGG